MGTLKIEEKQVVVPGEVLAEGMDYLPSFGTYRRDETIYASRLGLAHIQGRTIKLIPLSGKYLPKSNDVIIGKVIDVTPSGWRFETNTAYSALLGLKEATSEFIQRGADLTQYFDIGDYAVCKIINVTSQMLVDLSTKGPGLHRLRGGRVITVNSNKVPRIIGKQGSMVSMIKQATGCKIIVGQNGVIWLNGSPKAEVVAVQAVRMIEKESHTSGLTERVKAFLDEACKDLPAPEQR